MPKKPNIKEWLLEQQKKLDAELGKEPQTVKPWVAQWNKSQQEADEKYNSPNAIEPNPWQNMKFIKKPDPPMRRFPTRTGELYYGRVPDYRTLAKLRDMGAYCIWNLAEEYDVFLEHERAYVPHVIHGNIPDYDVPSNGSKFLRQVYEVVAMLKANKIVFLHCAAGHGRTGMTIAALDLILNDHNAKQALGVAKAATTGPETPGQVAFIKALAKHLKKESSEDDELKSTPQKTVSPEQGELDRIINRYEHKPKVPEVKKKTDNGRELHMAKLKQRIELMQQQRDKERLELEKQDALHTAKRYKEQQEAKKKPKP